MASELIDRFLRTKGVASHGCGSLAAIERVAGEKNISLPDELIDFWLAADGMALEPLNGQIFGTFECLELISEGVWKSLFESRGLLPIVYDNQSNYLAVAVNEPLAPRIVHVPHDDGSRLLYRGFSSMMEGVLVALGGDKDLNSFLRDTDGDYAANAPRNGEDGAAARALLKMKNEDGEWNFALQLSGDSDIDAFAKLLETDHFVRRDVLARMKKMSSPAIKKLLHEDQISFHNFALRVEKESRDAGFEVGEQKGDALRVNSAWISLEAFYYRRNIPNAMPRMMDWLRDFFAKRNPHDRAGHFMID